MSSAPGKTTEPMSRPSTTPPPCVPAQARWRSTRCRRTSGLAATTETARPTSGERMRPVTSSPSMTTRSPTSIVDAPPEQPTASILRRASPSAGRGRRPPGTWRPYRAVRRRAARPPPSTRSTCRHRPGRRWRPAAGAGAAAPAGQTREVLGEGRVAGLDGAEPGDEAALARHAQPSRPRRRPWPSGGRPGCRSGRRAAGPPTPVTASVSPSMRGAGAEGLDHVGHRAPAGRPP